MKRIRRVVKVICPDCMGNGYEYIKGGGHKDCSTCKGTGETDRYVTEIVSEDEEIKQP